MKRRKSKKTPSYQDHRTVRFELEKDADEIFRNYIEQEVPPDKDLSLEIDDPLKSTKPQRRHSVSYHTVDLHGLTLDEAQDRVDQLFRSVLAHRHRAAEITIITGKGRHSGANGPVLAGGIHFYIRQKYDVYIQKIDESPDSLIWNGLPLRGHFTVVLKS